MFRPGFCLDEGLEAEFFCDGVFADDALPPCFVVCHEGFFAGVAVLDGRYCSFCGEFSGEEGMVDSLSGNGVRKPCCIADD